MKRKYIVTGVICAIVVVAFVVMMVHAQEKSKTQHAQDLVDDMFHTHIRFTVESLRAKDMIHNLYGQLIKNSVNNQTCKQTENISNDDKKSYEEIKKYIDTNVIPFFNGVTKINDQIKSTDPLRHKANIFMEMYSANNPHVHLAKLMTLLKNVECMINDSAKPVEFERSDKPGKKHTRCECAN